MVEICYLSRSSSVHDERWIRALREAGYGVTQVTARGVNAGRMALTELVRSTPIDLVVAGPLTDATVAATKADVAPVVGIAWGFDLLLELGEDGMHALVQQSIRQCAAVHADCNFLADKLTAMGVEPGAVSVGAWGIDTDFFSPGPRRHSLLTDARWPQDSFVVVTTRSWAPMYDVETAIRGFAWASSHDARLRLVWAGDGPQATELRELVRNLDIQDVVLEVGRLAPAALRDWLRSCDLYVSASKSDGSSLSLLEALAVGTPSVVTDLVSNREWVSDEDFGRVFPPEDAQALGEAILLAVQRPSSRSQREKRREAVLLRGDWRKNRTTFLRAVERALG